MASGYGMHSTPVQFLDGGLGTCLEDAYGVHFSETTPLWSSHLLLSDHQTLASCQHDFAKIPVDILLTATYQVSVEGFRRTQTDSFPNGVPRSEIPPFLDLAVAIAEQVKSPVTKLALSLGPYGAVMMPSQEYSARYDDEHDSTEKLFRWHADRMRLFAGIRRIDARVDFVAFETIPRLDEILAIRKLTALLASKSVDSDDSGGVGPLGRTPYWISCVFPDDNQVLPDGSSTDQVIRALLSLEHSDSVPWGIGINCTKIARLPSLIQAYESGVRLLEYTGRLRSWPSLVLYPDGTNGEVYDTTTKTWVLADCHTRVTESSWECQLADIVTKARSRRCWRSIVVGGCCKATPADIARLRTEVFRAQ
ncbi:Homocysteine S-methyltransferase [Xylariaceae sp. FL1651]|nr:Homocysteine S-methyltransferase [Xylariaceae sp. FL1651]